MFVDECQLNVRGGDGGAGCVSFRREGPVVNGGPNGGDGGRGGDVWIVADHNVASLLAFRDHPHRRATSGVHGKGKDLHGRGGQDEIVYVPEGTVVTDLYTGDVLAELLRHGDRWLAAGGGRGGRGNAKFLSNKRRAPTFAEQGEHGEERWLKLELQLMADVALVGFPNVGKSTLISVISAAKPKIADYPFTTLEPNLGVVRLDETTEFVVADIPGLIEGASEGKGLGHRFLRHVERARVLCILVDLAALDGTPPGEQERVLLDELARYKPELLERPRLFVGTKADLIDRDDLDALGFVPDGDAALRDLGGHRRRPSPARRGDGRGRARGAHQRARSRGRRAAAADPHRLGGRAPRRARVPSLRPRRRAGGRPQRRHAPTTPPPTSATASTGWASTSCSPGPAPSTATSSGSAASASSTRHRNRSRACPEFSERQRASRGSSGERGGAPAERPDARPAWPGSASHRQDRDRLAHRRPWRDRRVGGRQAQRGGGRTALGGPRRRGRLVGRGRRRCRGPRARHPAVRRADAAGDLGGRPAAPDAQLGRRPGPSRTRAGTGTARPAGLHRPPPVPARPAHADPPARAGRHPDRQRERRHRVRRHPLRRQRPAVGAGRPQPRRLAARVAHRPRRPVHRRPATRSRRPSSSTPFGPTTRCSRFAPAAAAAAGGAAAWRASWRRRASRRGRVCRR